MSDLTTAIDARGRWREILEEFGLPEGAWRKQKGPCPICGGRDRYHWTDKDGDGWGFCQKCGGLPGLLLVRKFKGWDHRQACDAIDEILARGQVNGNGGNGHAASPRPGQQSLASKQQSLDRLLAESNRPDIVAYWYKHRGLSVTSPGLRGHPACVFRDPDGVFVAHVPAVVAPISAPDGRVISAQRLYLGDRVPIGERKKEMPAIGPRDGAAIRLHEPSLQLGIAEGIATALAAFEIFGIPTWAVIDAGNMRRFTPPEGVTQLTIYGDNDRSFTGQAAAYSLAERLAKTTKLKLDVLLPDELGTDWNDALSGRAP